MGGIIARYNTAGLYSIGGGSCHILIHLFLLDDALPN
jgi:hypothetical protein